MLRKISRAKCLSLYPKFPRAGINEYSYHFPKTVNNYILTFKDERPRIRSIAVASACKKLLLDMGFKGVLFLADDSIPWLYRKGRNKPAKAAVAYLESSKVGKLFNGAIEIDVAEDTAFMRHLYWLTRTNTISSLVHFMDPRQEITGSICQYGNIHLSSLNKEADRKINNALKKSELTTIERC